MSGAALTLMDLVFYVVAILTVACAAYAVFSSNIVRAVFSLLGTFFGVAILYGMLAADFVAVIQVMVYVGGILVLMLMAVMLTGNIEMIQKSNQPGNWVLGALTGIVLLVFLISVAVHTPWIKAAPAEYAPTAETIGRTFLNEALLPFEILSVVLLGVIIGAVVVARARHARESNQ